MRGAHSENNTEATVAFGDGYRVGKGMTGISITIMNHHGLTQLRRLAWQMLSLNEIASIISSMEPGIGSVR